MKNLFFILMLIASVTACRSGRNIATLPISNISDSTTEKDSTYKLPPPPPLKIKGDTIRIIENIPCPNDTGNKKPVEKELTSGRLHVKYSYFNGQLKLYAFTDSLMHAFDSVTALLKKKERIRIETKYIPTPVPKPYIPLWMVILVLIAGIDIGYRLYKIFK